jgi:hypothetical protein
MAPPGAEMATPLCPSGAGPREDQVLQEQGEGGREGDSRRTVGVRQ